MDYRLFLALVLLYPATASGLPQKINEGSGTSGDPYIVTRSETAITVDAKLEEETWNDALLLELLYEVEPGENVSPPVKTEVLITYTDQYLYAAFRSYDPDPSSILAHFPDRDSFEGDDSVGLILDTFNDERSSCPYYSPAA